jgi:hypothetical protein
MKPHKAAILVLALFPALITAQHKGKKKPDVPAVFGTAHYVYVQAESGDVLRPDVYPADRQAIADVQVGIQDWKRYVVTLHRDQADLVFVVRKGRIAAGQTRGGVNAGSQRQPGVQSPGQFPQQGQGQDSMGVESEFGPEDDQLKVFVLNGDGKLTGPVWTRELKDGLEGPKILLLQLLKESVDRAFPVSPPPPQSNP